MSQTKNFAGFGLGAIQSGLFLLEAQRTQNYARFSIAEVDPSTVAAVRAAGGSLAVNIAHKDPFDRLLIAQAQAEDMVLVSNEELFDSFAVKRLW